MCKRFAQLTRSTIAMTAATLVAACGSAPGTGRPVGFAGALDVASTAGSVMPYVTETPRAAGAFVDSIGVNIHLGEAGSPYTADFSTMVNQMVALGIHHVRDGMQPGQTALCNEAQTLASAGIRFDYITAVGDMPSDITGWAACAGSAVESFEGPNEYDLTHPQSDGNWPATLASFQQMLYATVKGDASLASTPVIGPSLTSQSAYASVGNLAAYEDDGNMHDYFGGRNPGTPGYGAGGYGSIPYNIATARQASVGLAIDATETGYPISSTAVNPYVTGPIAGKYMPRLFFEHWNAGVPRTWAYEFYDEGSPPSDTYGWVRSSTLKPKFEYTAMRSLISVVADKALTLPAPTPLNWSMSGSTNNVHHTLLQKSNGSTYLALWIETPANDPNAGTIYTIPPQAIVINLTTVPKSVTEYQYDATMTLKPTTLTPSATIQLNVGDTVTLLKLT